MRHMFREEHKQRTTQARILVNASFNQEWNGQEDHYDANCRVSIGITMEESDSNLRLLGYASGRVDSGSFEIWGGTLHICVSAYIVCYADLGEMVSMA